MNNQQLLRLGNTLNGVEIEFQKYRQRLEKNWDHSITTLVDNLFAETRTLLQRADRQKLQTISGRMTDVQMIQERAVIFNEILSAWRSAQQHFLGFPEATKLLRVFEQQIYCYQAHTKFYESVALVNSARFREYDVALMQQKASGFLALAETVDFFTTYLDSEDLKEITQIAQKAIEVSARTVQDYAETDPERSHLETQIRAASYLILARLQQQTDNESEINGFHSSLGNSLSNEHRPSEQDWDKFMTFLEESQDDMGVTDLAHQHDHYLHGAPKRLES